MGPAAAVDPPPEVRITFAAVGDLNFGTPRSVLQRQEQTLAQVQSLFSGRDMVYGNLETPVASRPLRNAAFPRDCKRMACSKAQAEYAYWYKITFWTSPSTLQMLRNAGFTVLGTANNHAMDQGGAGLLETLTHLQSAQLGHAGTGRTAEEAWKPYVYEKQGVKVALLSATTLLNLPDPVAGAAVAFVLPRHVLQELPRRVRELKKTADFVVVALHFGCEMEWRTAREEREWIRELAQAGCDLFIGAHPHVLRGISVHGSMPAFHSLGNFIFSINAGDRVETGVVHAEFVKDGRGRRVENVTFFPVRADGGSVGLLPRRVSGRLARAILNNLLYYSRPLGNPEGTLVIDGDVLRVNVPPAAQPARVSRSF